MDKDVNESIRLECLENIIAIQDAVEVLSGKWRVAIIVALNMKKELCFKELKSELPYISAKVLTQELKFLEKHMLISRVEQSLKPLKVIYSLSAYGLTLNDAIFSLLGWGLGHRQLMLGKEIETDNNAKRLIQIRNNLYHTC